jgi:PAS domain S-box-containing protein
MADQDGESMALSAEPTVVLADAREREFGIEELFFSTTDVKGHISAGNEVFTRISGYTEDELLGRAHNVIRHPDMPRGVFQLLWDTIQAGRPIAAYVKNRAKDGELYFADYETFMCAALPAEVRGRLAALDESRGVSTPEGRLRGVVGGGVVGEFLGSCSFLTAYSARLFDGLRDYADASGPC